MRKRFVKVVLFGALAFATTTSFISCKDYDDDIKRIDNEIGQLNKSLTDLKTAIGNNGVKSVSYDAATGTLTIVDSNDKSVSCKIAQNLPEYSLEIKDGKVILKKDGSDVSSATLPSAEVADSFDPTKLTINAEGEVLYDGAKTGVKIPKATSSIASIKKDGVVIGYTVTENGVSSNFYIEDALPLTSLVFVPEAYLSGVEAMRATNLTYDKWTVNTQAVTEKGEIWNAPANPASNSNITPDMVAYYHVNPIGVTMKQISKLVLSADDKEFVGTRATDFNIANIDLEKCSITDGILKVVFNGNSEAIQKIDASKITVMNLKATVEVNGGSKTVASDYAAIYKSILKDFVLANAQDVGVHKAHLYGADATNTKAGLVGKAEDAIAKDPLCEVAYNNKEGIDLSKWVETHYTEWTDANPMKQIGTGDKTIANDKLADYGLKLVYSLSDYYKGDNKTLQSSFFANLNGSVLTAKVGSITEDPIAAVGRMPLVRVELQNASNGEVVNVGWIKVMITRGDVAGTDYPKACGDLNLQCTPKTWNLTFDEMNVYIYQKLGLTKEDFHAIYELKSTSTNPSGQKVATLKAGEYGEVVELNDADPNVETVCLAWTVTDVDQLNAIAKDGQMIATATYQPKNDKSRADVTITFTASVKSPSASFDTGSKNTEYWYNNMNNIRMNTVVPGVTPNDCSFSVNVDNVFEGNKPSFKLNNTVSDDFKLANISYQYIFSAENNNVKVMGNDGKEYTLTVTANGKELRGNTALVAKIVGTNVEYQETPEAKAILNISAHDVAPFTAKLDMVLTNKCNMRLPMTDGQFNAEFLRPINVFANEGKYFVDATDEGYTVKMLDLVYLTDWRDYKFAKGTSASGVAYDGSAYYDYYKVQSIVADTEGITTNMNNSDIKTKKLSEVTTKIEISQADATVVGNYGTITYKNNGNNVKPFKIRIPIVVTYKWGTVKTYVDMDVKQTEGN